MRNSLIIIAFFCAGVLSSVYDVFPAEINPDIFSTYTLWILMFFSGIVIGTDPHLNELIKNLDYKIILIPAGVAIGSLAGGAVLLLFTRQFYIADILSVSAGFGYYSLSSILIREFSGETMGVLALLTNIIREVTTLLLAPLLPYSFGKLSIVAAGGATSMDTTLPVIIKFTGKQMGLIGLLSGMMLTILVPFIIPFIYYIAGK